MDLAIEELKEARDLDLGASGWLRVDQERIDRFAEATEDRQWIHVDPARAAGGPFGGTIAHGYLTLSLVPRLLAGVARFVDAAATINYGIDKLRFLHPVPAGSELRLHAVLLSATERPNGVLVRLKTEIELRGSGARALFAEVLYLVVPEPSPK